MTAAAAAATVADPNTAASLAIGTSMGQVGASAKAGGETTLHVEGGEQLPASSGAKAVLEAAKQHTPGFTASGFGMFDDKTDVPHGFKV